MTNKQRYWIGGIYQQHIRSTKPQWILTGTSEKVLIFLLMLFAGSTFCLPVPNTPEIAILYPWWATRFQIDKILFHEILFMGWFMFFGFSLLTKYVLKHHYPGKQAGIYLTILALWCGLISLTAPLPQLDSGRTLRLLLNVSLFFAVIRWSQRYGNFPIVCLIIGFFVGTTINLVISFQFPLIVNNVMRLSGQNTPGVAMGIAIHLTAWLFYRAENFCRKIFAIMAMAVFFYGCAISYSRIGWFAGVTGILLWIYIAFLAKAKDSGQIKPIGTYRKMLGFPLIILAVTFFVSPIGQKNIEWMQQLVIQKQERLSESNSIRWAYFIGTLEILFTSPFGVGYSGFYDAIAETEVYRRGESPEEESNVTANPHASILWYTVAGGIPGAILATLTFVALLNTLRVGLLFAFQKQGKITFVLIGSCYIVIAFTVPYIFNSIILIIPVAIAAGWGRAARIQ